MKTWWTLILTAALLSGLSCGRTSNDALVELKEEAASTTDIDIRGGRAAGKAARADKFAAAKPVPGSAGFMLAAAGSGFEPVQEVIRTRMVIKTGQVAIEVEKYDEAAAELQKLVAGWGGFVANSTTEIPYENVKTGTWILRVPAEKFDIAMEAVKKLGRKLERESIGGEDVTEEFYDLEARLQNKLLEEKQVRDILRRAGTITEVLEVQRELSRIREEIERFEGRKKYLLDRTGLSTITVELHDPYPVAMSARGGFWATIGSGFTEGFRGFASVLAGTITFLIAGLPVFILIGVVVWLFVRLIRRAMRKKKEGAQAGG
jgi:hypothetical protein